MPTLETPLPATVVTSNVTRADYAGSKSCAPCHREIYDGWQHAPMRNMTRIADGSDIAAPFDGSAFHFKDDLARFETLGGRRFIQVESKRFGDHLYRVNRVIGGHHREDFTGIEVDAPDAEPRRGAVERVMPVSFLLGPRTFRYKGYSVMITDRPGLRVGAEWAKTCILCHNTAPYLTSLIGALSNSSTRPYQGEVVDPLLPPSLRWRYEVTDSEGMRRALTDEITLLDDAVPDATRSVPKLLAEAVRSTRDHFGAAQLVEVGIGCESCHGGCREHVATPSVKPSFDPHSPFLRVRSPGASRPTSAERINRTCAHCHQVLFSRYAHTWEGGDRSRNPGGSNINSGEARDLLMGACASKLSCIACHDPHSSANAQRMEELDGRAGNEVCLRCHDELRGAAAQRAHSHHAPDGAGGLCMNCHMPKKNLSLEARLTRYHRIGSPNDPVRVERDRPLECALCHADRSVEDLVGDMERWWGKKYDRAALRRLYGSLSRNVMMATLTDGKPHEQSVAIAALGEARARDSANEIGQQLTHPYPIVRGYALAALERIIGQHAPIDLSRDDAEIEAAARRWLDGAGIKNTAPRVGSEGNAPARRPSEAEDE